MVLRVGSFSGGRVKLPDSQDLLRRDTLKSVVRVRGVRVKTKGIKSGGGMKTDSNIFQSKPERGDLYGKRDTIGLSMLYF